MQRFKDILCVVEVGQADKPVLERAVTLAENNQARLTVVEVVERVTAGIGMPDGGPISADLQAALVTSHAKELETLVDPLRDRVDIQTGMLAGTPFLEIIHEVLRSGHDLVIKSPEDRDWLDRLFGSDDMHLLRKCPCPVWLIKPGKSKSYRCILAAVNVDDAHLPAEMESRRALNQQILEMASSLALSDFAELHVAHAWDVFFKRVTHVAFMHVPEEKITSYVEQERRRHAASLDALMREIITNLGQDALEYLKPRTRPDLFFSSCLCITDSMMRKRKSGVLRRLDAATSSSTRLDPPKGEKFQSPLW